ncbi:MAG: acetolactate synthase large subunit, partial [Elusimicrobiota bacterium]|nr:acetolactate synthase large subunit [Elusimicrobiota bacterium]
METENVAQRVVRILKSRDVEFVFGIPGEENIYLVDAISKQTAVKFILTRHEQGASFMAEVYGRLLQKPAVAIATLGPGAINLLLGTADALTTQVPLIAISAQAGTD